MSSNTHIGEQQVSVPQGQCQDTKNSPRPFPECLAVLHPQKNRDAQRFISLSPPPYNFRYQEKEKETQILKIKGWLLVDLQQ